jgi:hypothetical protein
MRVDEAIYESLKEYPSLYVRPTYEESKRDILHHYFIVLGNGIDWAWTKNPEDGGYLTEPEYYKSKKDEDGYPLRKYNKPYNKSGIVIDEEYLVRCRTKRLFYVFSNDIHAFPKRHPRVWEDQIDTIDRKKYHLSEIDIHHTFHPYPNFQKGFSCFWENDYNSDGYKYIQEDWRLAAIEHLQYCKAWFENEDNIKEDSKSHVSYFYNPESIEKRIAENKGKKGFKQLSDYTKGFDWKGDFALLARLLNDKQLNSNLTFINETIERLETKNW